MATVLCERHSNKGGFSPLFEPAQGFGRPRVSSNLVPVSPGNVRPQASKPKKFDFWERLTPKNEKASGTQGCSRTVPQFSTDRALRRLTSEFGRDPVYSARYGRQRRLGVEFRKMIALPLIQAKKIATKKTPPKVISPQGTQKNCIYE